MNLKKTKHTPGPWKFYLDVGDLDNATAFIKAANGALVCEMVNAQKDDNAEWSSVPNAQLIAAAPEMLAALETFANIGLIRNNRLSGEAEVHEELKAALDQAFAISKKAKGES